MLFYLINKKWGRCNFFFNLDTLYSKGWGKSPLPFDIFKSNIPYEHKFYIALLSYAFATHVMHKLKGKYVE